MTKQRLAGAAALALLFLAPARAAEGMWTFDAFPRAAMAKQFGWAPDQAWLDRVQGAAVRLSSGCSASVVSKEGLVLTNWHCVVGCAGDLSNPQTDLVKNGFTAMAREDEKVCPGVEADILASISDVTARVRDAMAKAGPANAAKARDGEIATIEKEACAERPINRCEVVDLYRGGQFKLYVYRKYSDVRLAFTPEQAIGFFGGDPDNFNFPRFNLDAAFLRLYENGAPAATPIHLGWRRDAPSEGEAVLIAGNPGSTGRLKTQDQLALDRDWVIPTRQLIRAQLRGRLYEYAKLSEENRRHSADLIFSVENSYKAFQGRWRALSDPAFMAAKRAEEDRLVAALRSNARLRREVGDPWADMARAVEANEELFIAHDMLEARAGSISTLFGYARTLVRAAEERTKPNAERLPQFTDSRLESTARAILEAVPVYPGMERIGLELWLAQARELMTVDDPAVQRLLGRDSPEALAQRLIAGTKLADPAVRKALWDGGAAAIAASDDPLIRFARAIDPDARAVQAAFETRVAGPMAAAAERIAQVRFRLLGAAVYPDATFTLRLTYGAAEGWIYQGRTTPAFTRLGGLFERATGAYPFELPQRWLDAKPRLALDTPFNMSSSNDIIGGNSGSPAIDREGRVVGAIFDGNIHSLGGDYGYDARINRAVTVLTPAISEALRKVYGAHRLIDEVEADG